MLYKKYARSRDIYKVSKGQAIRKNLNSSWDLMRRLLSGRYFWAGSGRNLHQIGNRKDKLHRELIGKKLRDTTKPQGLEKDVSEGKRLLEYLFYSFQKKKTYYYALSFQDTQLHFIFSPTLIGCSYSSSLSSMHQINLLVNPALVGILTKMHCT